MKSQLRTRARTRGRSLSSVPPPVTSNEYSPQLAACAAAILFRSPLSLSPSPSGAGHAVYILNSAALPDTRTVNYDKLLPYVLSRLPGEDELVGGTEYEIVFFAGGKGSVTAEGRRPGWGWLVQAYAVLSRAMRKRLRRLYVVHERAWVRVLAEMFSTVVSPKFRRKIVHAASLSALALHIPIENLLIPPSAYLRDRRVSPDIYAPKATGRRAFGTAVPFPTNFKGETRLPRVLRETTSFVLLDGVVQIEGVFRVSPQVKLREIVREAYDRGQKFLVWKEADKALYLPEYPAAIVSRDIVEETTQEESFGVHVAAAVIKLWYSELRIPIIQEESYNWIKEVFGSSPGEGEEVRTEDLIDFLSPGSEVSPLGLRARTILSRHLLPLMFEVSSHSEQNKMTPENLAVCFAPTLMCGQDQIEDVRMTGILKRVIGKAVEEWPVLQEIFGIEKDAFRKALEKPENWDDYEDPLDTSMEHVYENKKDPKSLPKLRAGGIIMQDNDPASSDYDEDSEEIQSVGIASPAQNSPIPPPLPPRSTISSAHSPVSTPPLAQRAFSNPIKSQLPPNSDPFYSKGDRELRSSSVKRKPAPTSNPTTAPPPILPPRYSVVMNDLSSSPSTYVASDGFGPPRRSGWSIHESDLDPDSPASGRGSPTPGRQIQGIVKRKPVGDSSRDGSGNETGLGVEWDK